MIQAGDTTICWGDTKGSGYAGKLYWGPLETCTMNPAGGFWEAYYYPRLNYLEREEHGPMLYSRKFHYWHPSDESGHSGLSMPYAVMDDYGFLIAVPSPDA